MTFDMTGVVTDADGRPVPGAKVIVWRDWDELPSVLTDGSGRYKLGFSGAPGSIYYPNADPPGTQDAVAFLEVEAPGFERVAHYILGTAERLVQNVRLHRLTRISAGESMVLSIGPDDTVCAVDGWPARALSCGIVHVLARTTGTMTVEAVPITGEGTFTLEVYSHHEDGGGRGNPVSIPVTAGIEYIVDVAVPWGASRSLALKTAITAP